jgi:hypothetical protein
LTSFSEVFEKILYRRLLRTHINTKGILASEQFGFPSKFSTERASCNSINEVLTIFNNKSKVGGVFFLA